MRAAVSTYALLVYLTLPLFTHWQLQVQQKGSNCVFLMLREILFCADMRHGDCSTLLESHHGDT